MSVQVDFISIWSGKEFTSKATVDTSSGAITSIKPGEKTPGKTALLEDEYIVYFENDFDIEKNANGAYYISEDSFDDFQSLVNG